MSASVTLKNRWFKSGSKKSLRQFARDLVKAGDPVAQEWFDNKAGAKDLPRSDVNASLARATASASKLARRKSKSGGKSKAADIVPVQPKK